MFRRMWNDYYLNGKGFTAEDLEKTVTTVAGRDYREFFDRYVWGTTPPPVLEVFGYAGYSIVTEKTMTGQPIEAGEK